MTEQRDKAAAEPPLDCDVIPPEVLDLVRFMCATWSRVDAWAYSQCDGEALMHYPVVQGVGNQIKLLRIGEQKFDPANIHKAAAWMQRYNASGKGPEAAG